MRDSPSCTTAPPPPAPSSPLSSGELAELARPPRGARTRAGRSCRRRGGPRRGRRAGGRSRPSSPRSPRGSTAAASPRAAGARRRAGGRRTLHADAADLGLPPGGDELAEVEAALGRLRETLAALWPAISRRGARRACAHARRGGRSAAESEHGETAARLTEAEHQLGAAIERRDTLQATAGAAIAELERRLGEVAGALTANDAAQRGTEDRLGKAQRADGAAEALRGSSASSWRSRPTQGSSPSTGCAGSPPLG